MLKQWISRLLGGNHAEMTCVKHIARGEVEVQVLVCPHDDGTWHYGIEVYSLDQVCEHRLLIGMFDELDFSNAVGLLLDVEKFIDAERDKLGEFSLAEV